MLSLSNWIIRYRWPLLIVLTILTVILFFNTQHLTTNNDYDTFLPDKDKISIIFKEVDKVFSSNALVFVVLDFPENGVFHPESLALVKQMTLSLEGMEELFNVTSLINIVDIRKINGDIEVGDLIPEIPEEKEKLDKLKEYVLSKEMYVDAVISRNARYTVLVANIDGKYDEVGVCGDLLETIEAAAGKNKYYFGGDPALTHYLDVYMNQDLIVLLPIMFFVMVVVLYAGLRSLLGVILPLSLVVLCIIWTFGLQANFNMSINFLTPALAIMLVAMGSDYAVHIYNHYLKRGDIVVSTAEITLPVVMSAVTTIGGLLTFATTKIKILQFFGYELVFGLGSVCLLSIILLPICIYIFKPTAKTTPVAVETDDHLISIKLAQLGGWVHNHIKVIFTMVFIGLVTMGFGISKISTSVDFVTMLPEESPPRQGSNILEEEFSGIYPASIYCQGDIEHPGIMKELHRIENFMRSEQALSSFTSITDLIAEENWLMNGIYAIPDTRAGVANLWFLLEGQESLKTMITTDRKKSLINGMLKEPSTGLMKKMVAYLESFFKGDSVQKIVELDPAKLSDEGRRALEGLIIKKVAEQLSWLAQGYDKSRKYAVDFFEPGIAKGVTLAQQGVDPRPAWQEAERYLTDEAVELLPPGLIAQLLKKIEFLWPVRNRPETKKQLAEIITSSGIMDEEDAKMTISGLFKRSEFAYRLLQVAAVRDTIHDKLSAPLKQDKNFRKRADGVLWELFTQHPVLSPGQLEALPGGKQAITNEAEFKADVTGIPTIIRRFDELLFISQLQSLILASIIVLVLVSLTQLSIKRGLISLLSVLIPLEFIMGLMGWAGIPLDLGTVLCGALIIGLGVDGSIHFLHYYYQINSEGIHGEAALRTTMGHVGKAIITANATTCCGFVVLLFSKTTVVRNFGIINALAIFLVTISILTFLPALVTLLNLDKNHKNC